MRYYPRYRQLTATSADDAAALMFWFTHAGGVTQTLATRLQGVELDSRLFLASPWMPMREQAADEEFTGDLTTLAKAFAEEIATIRRNNQPIILTGHSFGSIVAYEVCRALLPLKIYPQRLVAQCFPPPDALDQRGQLHKLDDQRLISHVHERFGGFPAALREDPAAQRAFAPALRFDLRLLEEYGRAASVDVLPTHITAVSGTEDPAFELTQLQGWSRMTEHPLQLRAVPGDHFAPLARMGEVIRLATWDVIAAGP